MPPTRDIFCTSVCYYGIDLGASIIARTSNGSTNDRRVSGPMVVLHTLTWTACSLLFLLRSQMGDSTRSQQTGRNNTLGIQRARLESQASPLHPGRGVWRQELLAPPTLCHKEPARGFGTQKDPMGLSCLPSAKKDSWLPFTERSYYRSHYAMKNQRTAQRKVAKKDPSLFFMT